MTGQRSKNSDEYKSVFGNRRKVDSATAGSADWSSATPKLLLDLVGTVSSRGGAVRFGYTRDGGAYAVGFYYGSESTTEYCRPTESLDDFLVEWVEFYKNLPNTAGKSPDQKR